MDQNVELDARVERALEQAPVVRIPEGFAAKVAAAAAAQPVVRVRVRRRISLGHAMTLGAMVVVLVALFVVAPMAGTKVQSWPFALEMVLLAQLAGLGFGVMRKGSV
ncbi:hypothetical protein [Granulicella paludicola]|uniref:hypothetical protein n=1 Tax=Granulicella paludicola TaxID=474951 RepID=UPI0021E00272|nr:hypothetical protein [Granulicella paludicola]